LNVDIVFCSLSVKEEYKIKNDIHQNDAMFLEKVKQSFNDDLVFEPDILRMAYTIRDPIINRIYDNEINHGVAKR
jgi:hypothetical protein